MLSLSCSAWRVLGKNRYRGAKMVVAAAAVFGFIGGGDILAQETITLRTVTPYQPTMYLSQPIYIFKEMVEERTGGRVKVDILGGEEVVPSLQQFDALRTGGVVDMIVGVTSYYSGAIPEGLVFLYSRKRSSELRQTDFHELMRQIHLEKGDVIYLANAGGTPGSAFRLYFRNPPESADFSGLSVRVSPVYTALVEALGGTPVSIPFADTYTALERGMVDGFGSTYAGISDYGLDEVSGHVLDHAFYSLNLTILFNRDVWESLPEDVREQLEDLAPDFEHAVEQYMDEYLADEDDRLRERGMQFISLSGDDERRFLDAAYDAAWAAFLAETPEYGERLMELAQ